MSQDHPGMIYLFYYICKTLLSINLVYMYICYEHGGAGSLREGDGWGWGWRGGGGGGGGGEREGEDDPDLTIMKG